MAFSEMKSELMAKYSDGRRAADVELYFSMVNGFLRVHYDREQHKSYLLAIQIRDGFKVLPLHRYYAAQLLNQTLLDQCDDFAKALNELYDLFDFKSAGTRK